MDPLRATSFSLPAFAAPNLTLPYDIFMTTLAVVFMALAGIANLFPNVPLLNQFARGGAMLSYSKFAAGMTIKGMVPSRFGMTMLYSPSIVVALYFLSGTQQGSWDLSIRSNLVAAMVAIHFAKRTLECLFLHKYSGEMPLSSSAFISTFYCLAAHGACHFARLVPTYDAWTLPVGCLAFAVGILGNLYHHYLLATLRKPGEKGYKVPRGGLFEYVAAPHYMFELLGWFGIVLVTQHLVTLLMFTAMCIYLADRSVGQDEWNRKKIPQYPKHRKRMIPYIF
jgi:protein-S-isoprenylcysteine O-methyltransferase Ste14